MPVQEIHFFAYSEEEANRLIEEKENEGYSFVNATFARNLNSDSNAPYSYVYDVTMVSSGDD